MVFQYRIAAPGSELHGESFDLQAVTRSEADRRAQVRVSDTFALTTRTDVRAVFVAEYTSRRAMEKALDEAEERAFAEDRSDVADEFAFRQERAS